MFQSLRNLLETALEGTMSTTTLYDRLGGIYGIAGAVDILVDRLFANVAVNANDGVHAHHGDPANGPGYKFLVTAWSVEQFDAVAMEIEATLNFVGVPKAEMMEFMAIIERYRGEVVQAEAVPA